MGVTQDQIDWLLAQAEKLTVVAAAEDRALAAKAAYRANTDDAEAKAEHRAASTALAEARAAMRDTAIVDPPDGHVVVIPGSEG